MHVRFWEPADAAGKNAALKDKPELQKLWADTANGTLRTQLDAGKKGDEAEGIAIATANKAVAEKLEARGEPHGDQDVPAKPARSVTPAPPVERSEPGELHVRLAPIAPASLDDAARTVRAVLATDAPCLSMDMKTKKSVLEVYLMEGLQPVDQVPLCDTHQRDSIERVKGSIREIAVSGGRVEGTLCLDPTEESAWSKIRNRHVTDVSAGFQPVESVELKPGQTRTIAGRTFAAPADRSLSIHTKWRLREVSVTPIGSDEQAKIRTMSDRASGGLFDEHGRFNPNHDEAGRFAESGSGAADKASKAAEKAGKGARSGAAKQKAAEAHGKAHAAHKTAAARHTALAQYHKSAGNKEQAKSHFAAAKEHREKAAGHKAAMGRDFISNLHIRTILLGDPEVNETLRKWLEANLNLRAEATPEEASAFWDAASDADRARAEGACREADDDDDDDDDEDDDEDKKPAKKRSKERAAGDEAVERVRSETAAAAVSEERKRVAQIRKAAGSDVPAEIVARAIEEGWGLKRFRGVALEIVRQARSPSVGGGGNTNDVEMVRMFNNAPAGHVRSHEADCTVATLAASLLTRSYNGNQDPCDILGGYQASAPMMGDDGKPEAGQCHTVRSDVTRMLSGQASHASDARRKAAERLLEMGDRYRGMTPMDIVDECNRIEGRTRTTYDREERVRAAISGSALAAIFTQNVSAQFLGGYLDAADTTQGWVTESDVLNFLTNERAIYGKMGQLARLAKGGTADDLDTSDWNETYKVYRYAGKFVVDEQDFINDRFGAIAQMSPQDMGLSARQIRPNLVYATLLSNPTLTQDGLALFDSSHNNSVTGAITDFSATAPTANAGPFQDATTLMGKQRLRNRVLNLRPRFVIASTELEWAINILYKSQQRIIASGSGGTYNPLASEGANVEARFDGRLDPLGCYNNFDQKTYYAFTTSGTTSGRGETAFLLARPGEQGAKTIEVGYRTGTGRAPRIRSAILREGSGQYGMAWDVNLDIGVCPLDYRGIVRLTGGGSQLTATGPAAS